MVASLFSSQTVANVEIVAPDAKPQCLHAAQAGRVSIARVTDGDTVVLDDDRRVRIIGINTLELNSARAPDRQWAVAAQSFLQKQLETGVVSLVSGQEEFDRHGRTLAHVLLEDGSSAAETLISHGLGLAIAVGANQRCAYQYESAEKTARKSGLGIWQKPGSWLHGSSPLTGAERGFHLITSVVTGIQESKNRTVLELQNGLRVVLNKHFLTALNHSADFSLQGERVEVRGWLGGSSGRQGLTLSHPTNLRVLSQ